ncbi:MAG: EamA family transporter [Steroidobacteraceae bacterium]
MTEVSQRHHLQMMLINAVWGFNLVAIKVGVDRFPPVFLGFLRFLIVGLLVLPWLRIRRGEMRWLLIAAVFGGGLQFAVMYTGVALSRNMSSVAIAGQLGVPFATILSVLVLGERIRWRRSLGIALSFAGVVVLGFNPHVMESWQGLALIVLGAFIGAIGLVAIKRVRELNALELQAWLSWGSLPIFLWLSLLAEEGQFESLRNADLTGVAAVLYSALAASLFAHTAYFALVHRYPVSRVAPLTVMAPVFSVAFAVLFLGDLLEWHMIIGGVMTLTGVAVIVMREGKAAGAGSLGPA